MDLTLGAVRGCGGATCDGWVGPVGGFAERVAAGRPLAVDDRPVADHIRRCLCCREEFEIAVGVLADEPV